MLKTNENFDTKLEFHYKVCFVSSLTLACLRIVALDFFALISDALTALMIYFTYTQRNKLMAAFCFVGGIIGLIFACVNFAQKIHLVSRKFYAILVFMIVVYSIVVYTYLSVISFFAYRHYTQGCPCPIGGQSSNTDSNYGSISQQDEEKQGFTAFSGKGTTIG